MSLSHKTKDKKPKGNIKNAKSKNANAKEKRTSKLN
jgi:hypothetical protein